MKYGLKKRLALLLCLAMTVNPMTVYADEAEAQPVQEILAEEASVSEVTDDILQSQTQDSSDAAENTAWGGEDVRQVEPDYVEPGSQDAENYFTPED